MTDLYKEEVVDPGDKASKCAKDLCVSSYKNNPAAIIVPRQPGNFRGAVDFIWAEHILQMMLEKKMFMTVQNDGAGGKPQFFTIIGTNEIYYRLGWEIIVMVIDDIARSGGFPVIFCNDVNAKKVTKDNFHLVEAMFSGMDHILSKARQINITGEFAIMKHSVTAFCDKNSDEQLILNWSGTGIGLSHQNKVIDGKNIKADMPIVGFWEPGYRCNGGTQHTNLILAKWAKGDIRNIWNSPLAMEFIKKLTIPSLSYAKTIARANGWLDDGSVTEPLSKMAVIAHLTGGGVKKLKEVLPDGIGAYLHNMPEPAPVLLQAQEMSFDYPKLIINDEKAHTTFHGGCGMMVVCKTENDAKALVDEAGKDGIKAQIVGKTIKSEPTQILIDQSS
ncbi:MAG: AIR synthase-related protein [Patescibacteria group bacterium]